MRGDFLVWNSSLYSCKDLLVNNMVRILLMYRWLLNSTNTYTFSTSYLYFYKFPVYSTEIWHVPRNPKVVVVVRPKVFMFDICTLYFILKVTYVDCGRHLFSSITLPVTYLQYTAQYNVKSGFLEFILVFSSLHLFMGSHLKQSVWIVDLRSSTPPLTKAERWVQFNVYNV